MKLYILHYESPELGYKIKGFANKKKAISYRAKIKKFCTNLTIVERDIPITKKGLLTAINYI